MLLIYKHRRKMIFHDASLEMVNVSEIFYFWSNTWIQIELESPIQWSQARQESGVLVELYPKTVLYVFFFFTSPSQ
jgi:hypothetical protein